MVENNTRLNNVYNRWPKKREFLAYYMLYKKYGNACNIGDAVNDLTREFKLTKRASINVLKRLKSMRFISIEACRGEVRITIKPLDEILDKYLENYVKKRSTRCPHSRSPQLL